MNRQRTIETLSADEFERVVEQYIEKAATWDGALPVETFFAAWEALAEDAPPLEVQATFVGNELVFKDCVGKPSDSI